MKKWKVEVETKIRRNISVEIKFFQLSTPKTPNTLWYIHSMTSGHGNKKHTPTNMALENQLLEFINYKEITFTKKVVKITRHPTWCWQNLRAVQDNNQTSYIETQGALLLWGVLGQFSSHVCNKTHNGRMNLEYQPYVHFVLTKFEETYIYIHILQLHPSE